MQIEGVTATEAIGLTMQAMRNSASRAGLFEGWRSFTKDPSEIRDVPCCEQGELRTEIHTVGDPYSTVALFAVVINSTGASGDVYMRLTANGPVES